MSVDAVTIGIALLGIVLWTWVSLRNIDRKLDKLLLRTKPRKKEEDSDHTSEIGMLSGGWSEDEDFDDFHKAVKSSRG